MSFNSYSISSFKDYEPINEWLANQLGKYPIVALTGDLGSGKTTFIQQFCESHFDIDEVSSPTYAIINVYQGYSDNGNLEVTHVDLYRLNDLEEALEIGMEDVLESSEPVFIEWPELIEPLLGSFIHIHLEASPASGRQISLRVVNDQT
ncbi:MAG: tRNA (adenosine(37)-N6)-threonylcarbamoyltransferase complex ATPase subunit type 1 TsaE [Saprospiraceae bacterium]|nr:tRNA (adenosine(37)-N6)-threonylcarbamoyltransferase complex ATPase subunit type 1 TsaE [Saprospiraceae bacterium]